MVCDSGGYIMNSQKIANELGLDRISAETADQLLDVLYRMEDEQCYECKKVSLAINYLQNKYVQIKPVVHFNSIGESGNIFVILARVKNALNNNDAFNVIWNKVRQGNYDEALATIREKVNLIDDDGIY